MAPLRTKKKAQNEDSNVRNYEQETLAKRCDYYTGCIETQENATDSVSEKGTTEVIKSEKGKLDLTDVDSVSHRPPELKKHRCQPNEKKMVTDSKSQQEGNSNRLADEYDNRDDDYGIQVSDPEQGCETDLKRKLSLTADDDGEFEEKGSFELSEKDSISKRQQNTKKETAKDEKDEMVENRVKSEDERTADGFDSGGEEEIPESVADEFFDEGRPMNNQFKATAVLDEHDGVCNDDDNLPSMVQFGNATSKWKENVKTEISDGRRHESAVSIEGINTQQKRDVLPLVECHLSFLFTNMNMVESSTTGEVNTLSFTPSSISRQFYLDQGSDLCPSSTNGLKSAVDKQENKWINVSTHCERDDNSFKQRRKHSPYRMLERDLSWKDDLEFQPKSCPLADSGTAGRRTSSGPQGEKSTTQSGYSSNTDTSLSRGGSSGGFGGGGGDDGDKHIREKFKNWQLPSKRKIEPKADKKQKGEAYKKLKMQRPAEEGVLDYREKAEASEQRQIDVEAIADDDSRGAGCTPLAATSSCNDGNTRASVDRKEKGIKWRFSVRESQEMSSPMFPPQRRQAPRPKMEVQPSGLQIPGPDNTRISVQLEKSDAGSALRITDPTFLMNAMSSLTIRQLDEIDGHPAAEREEAFPVALTDQSDSIDLQAMYRGSRLSRHQQ